MSTAEFMEWRTYDRHEPIGDERLDQQLALLTMYLVEINRSRNAPRLKLDDFLLYKPWRKSLVESEDKITQQKKGAQIVAWARAVARRMKKGKRNG